MPGIHQTGQKRPSPAIDEDEDEQSHYPSSVSVGSKRARHARDASDSPLRSNSHPSGPAANLNGLPNGADRYTEDIFQPGSLVRVKLKNFVTYTAAEFHLGSSLNMVIGPNGTGKSTLVCAICLGLGWGSEHLGRAKDLGAFVKHGATEAVIEIELAAGPGNGSNHIVHRTIRKEDNKSMFQLNGKRVPQSAVTTMAKGYSIQIDNLCQFLPQDRVTEFAKMSDVDRLRETQRAAAPPYMVECHDQLKGLRSEERGLETRQSNERSHLERLEKQQNATRDDVERFHQREGLLRKSKCLEKIKPIIEQRLRKEAIKQVENDLRTAKEELQQIDAEVEPVSQAQKDVETYRHQIQDVVKKRKNRLEMIKTEADKLSSKLDKEKQTKSNFADDIKAEVTSRKARAQDIARLISDIAGLERRRREQPVAHDVQSFEQQKASLRTRMSAIVNQIVDKDSVLAHERGRAYQMNEEHKKRIAERQQLDTRSGIQSSLLQKLSRDTARAWDWIAKNRASLSLKGEVIGPPILECSVPESRYASAVESSMRVGDLVAITCTNGDDQKLLASRLLSKAPNGLGLHDVYLRMSTKPLHSYSPPVASASLPQHGFKGYLLDYIRGPDAVLAMLCDNCQLHRTAFAASPISDQQHAAVSNSAIRRWVSGKEIYNVNTRREYNQSSTNVTQLRNAQYFIDQPANTEEKQQLDARIEELRLDVVEHKANLDGLRQEIHDCKEEGTKLKQERDDLQVQQDRLKKAVAEWNALPSKIDQKQTQKNDYAQQNAETNDRIRVIKAKSRDACLHLADLTLEYAKLVTQLRVFHESFIEAEIRLIEATSELNALKNENAVILEKQERKKVEINQLKTQRQHLREEFKRKHSMIAKEMSALNVEEEAIIQEYGHLADQQALDQEVEAVSARLEMMAEGNPGAIRAYQKREEEIEKTREKLAQYTASLEEKKEKISEIRERWEPELDALIAKISEAFAHNFAQIGCAGEVEVYKDEEDFDNWSIQISVRFREGEPLSVLNSHRQSGGERAVSTVFYLMALQDLAQSPFRVVDEINQGMDPRNERKVHERMVDIACQERTSQYFLVTPKLLTGLKFHPKMKVHVINSGEHIPDSEEGNGGWDFKAMAKIALRSRKGVGVGA